MAIIWTDDTFAPLNLDKQARNWRQTLEGSNVRMANRAAPLVALAAGANRLAARHPAVAFHMPQPITSLYACQAYATTADPLYRWTRSDYWVNGRSYKSRFVSSPRTSGTGDCYATRDGGAATEITAKHNLVASTSLIPSTTFDGQYTVERGASADAELDEGVSVFNGYQCLDVLIQDDEIDALDTSMHQYADLKLAKAGYPVLADLMAQIRATMHAARRYNMGMAFCWAGSAPPSYPSLTNHQAAVVTSATYVNIIDQTVTARDADSPGILVPARYRGRGTQAKAAGQTVRVDVRVLALSADDGIVRFLGPLGNCDVQIVGGAGLAWTSGETGHLDLDSTSDDRTDETAARNKIDIHAKVDSGTLYIYGMAGWYVYE